MTSDDLIYLIGLKQIQIEMLTKQVSQLEQKLKEPFVPERKEA